MDFDIEVDCMICKPVLQGAHFASGHSNTGGDIVVTVAYKYKQVNRQLVSEACITKGACWATQTQSKAFVIQTVACMSATAALGAAAVTGLQCRFAEPACI